MSWWGLWTPGSLGLASPLRRRLTRFRRLSHCYRGFLSLFVDAAEKQGGGFILDRQYIVSLGERAFRLGYEIVFHSTVLQPEVAPGSYAELDRLKADLRDLLARRPSPPPASPMPAPEGGAAPVASAAGTVSPEQLRDGRRRHVRLIDGEGYVASPGVAAGRVWLVKTEADLSTVPEDGVLLVRRLEPTAALLRALPHVGAILVEEAAPTDRIAALARSFRVPALLGLPGATRRLPPGELVTVDATDASVYAGVFAELILHHHLQGGASNAEPEDRLLHDALREMGSPLLATAHPEAHGGDRRTLCGIVRGVYTAALAQFVAGSLHTRQGLPLPAPGFSQGVRTIDLSLPGAGTPPEAAGKAGRTDPVAWLLDGLLSGAGEGGGVREAREGRGVVYRSDEAATALLLGEAGTVLLDASLTAGVAGNHVMVVVSAAASGEELDGVYAEAVRLGLVAVRAAGVVVAWREHIPQAPAREILTRAGELARRGALGPGAAREPAGRG